MIVPRLPAEIRVSPDLPQSSAIEGGALRHCLERSEGAIAGVENFKGGFGRGLFSGFEGLAASL
jgi:hypothetical protein